MNTNDNKKRTGFNSARKPFNSTNKKDENRTPGFSKIIEKNADFDQLIADIRRVTRVTAGGKHMSFSVTMLLGNNKGKIGLGTAKGVDVPKAIDKAKKEAMRNLITVPIVKDTIPYKSEGKFCASRILVKPAKEGKGVIAGGVVRDIMILAGIKNITCKILSGSHNAINNGKATFEALRNVCKIYDLENEKRNIKVDSKEVATENKSE